MKNIFVPSTFRDMHAERDALRDVAAELNDEAFRLGDGVSLCDLRWGVDIIDLDRDKVSKGFVYSNCQKPKG